jgi:hypothetical protein
MLHFGRSLIRVGRPSSMWKLCCLEHEVTWGAKSGTEDDGKGTLALTGVPQKIRVTFVPSPLVRNRGTQWAHLLAKRTGKCGRDEDCVVNTNHHCDLLHKCTCFLQLKTLCLPSWASTSFQWEAFWTNVYFSMLISSSASLSLTPCRVAFMLLV